MNNQFPNSGFPFWNGNNQQGGNQPCSCGRELQRVNQRIERIEREITRINRRLDNLERFNPFNANVPYSASNLTSTDDYQSGNYMI